MSSPGWPPGLDTETTKDMLGNIWEIWIHTGYQIMLKNNFTNLRCNVLLFLLHKKVLIFFSKCILKHLRDNTLMFLIYSSQMTHSGTFCMKQTVTLRSSMGRPIAHGLLTNRPCQWPVSNVWLNCYQIMSKNFVHFLKIEILKVSKVKESSRIFSSK